MHDPIPTTPGQEEPRPDEPSRAEIVEILASVEPTARLIRTWRFDGGLSSSMTGAEVEYVDGSRRRFVIRRRASDEPDFASSRLATEFRLLEHLVKRGLPVPSPRALDAEHRSAVFDYVEGAPRTASTDPGATGVTFAAQLVSIHAFDGLRPEFVDLPSRGLVVDTMVAERPDTVDDSVREQVARHALRTHWPPAPVPPVLLHGDFWPGNVLWRGDTIVAVIDWEDAAVGDPLADVAITRLDLRWGFGAVASRAFTDQYAALTGCDLTALPVWDLVAALRPAGGISTWAKDWSDFGRPDLTPAVMRAVHADFLDEALGALHA